MSDVRFRIVLASVPRTNANAVRYELSRLFDIDEDIAGDICSAAPIVILDALKPEAAVAVKLALEPILRKGAQLHITDAPCDDIPKVNWPELPELAQEAMAKAHVRQVQAETAFEQPVPAPARSTTRALAAFSCPACGEAFSVVCAAGEPEASRPGDEPAEPTRFESPAPKEEPVASSERPPSSAPAADPVAERAPVAAPEGEEAKAKAPAAMPEPLPVRHPDLDEGPLVRALQAKRERRESQRLVAEREEVPAPPSEPESEPKQLEAEPQPEPAPEPAQARRTEPIGALDIDEALRLLDNVIDEPAPVGVEPAPVPAAAKVPELDDLLDGSDLGDFSDFEADLEDLDLDSAPQKQSEGVRPPVSTPPVAGGSSAMLAPLDPEEALAILESARTPDSGDDLIFERPARGPVSDELDPLAPEQALALLAQSTAQQKQRRRRKGDDRHAPQARKTTRRAKARGATEEPATQRRPTRVSGRESAERGRGAQAPSARRGRSARRRAVEPSDGDPVHGLVLSRIPQEAKRARAAEIICELTGMPRAEAEDLTRRPVIPVLKGVPRKTAEEALERFRAAKISGRVTTRRLG